jgi:hypothetical protein
MWLGSKQSPPSGTFVSDPHVGTKSFPLPKNLNNRSFFSTGAIRPRNSQWFIGLHSTEGMFDPDSILNTNFSPDRDGVGVKTLSDLLRFAGVMA